MSANHLIIDGIKFDAETGELINEVEQVEVEIIENVLPDIVCNGGTHIKTNTEQLKRELHIYLEKYDVEVTADTEKDCSKMATELNKLAGNLDKKRKETASVIKKPADELKVAIDELIAIVQEKRTSIIDGVSVFKEKRFALIESLLKAKLEELYEENKVADRYRVCDIKPLILEGSLGKVALTKSAVESLTHMVLRVKKLEDTVTIRELQLSMLCDKAGLLTPIKLSEVENIIESDSYDTSLNEMIEKRLEVENEAKRQFEILEQKRKDDLEKAAQEKERKLLEQEELRKKEAAEAQEREIARIEKAKNDEIAKIRFEVEQKERDKLAEIERAENEKKQEALRLENELKAKEKATGKKTVTLTAIFEIEVNANVNENSVLAKYLEKLSKEFSTLKSLDLK